MRKQQIDKQQNNNQNNQNVVLKSCLYSLNKIAFLDDSQVCLIRSRKQ